jgi:hypothetical protein
MCQWKLFPGMQPDHGIISIHVGAIDVKIHPCNHSHFLGVELLVSMVTSLKLSC